MEKACDLAQEQGQRTDIPEISLYNDSQCLNCHFKLGFTKSNPAKNNIPELLGKYMEACPPFNHDDILECLTTIRQIRLIHSRFNKSQ